MEFPSVENISSPLKLSLVRRVRLTKALFLKLFRLFADDETMGWHDDDYVSKSMIIQDEKCGNLMIPDMI